jgi:hypothetical protein
LEDLIKIKPQLAVLNKKGCNRERVNQIVQKTEAFLNTMHAEVAKAKPSHAVTLVAYDPKRFLSIYRTSSWISRIVNAILSVLFGTNIHHVAIGILNKDKTRFMEGHLFRTNMQDPNARYYNLQNPMPLSHWGFQQIQLDPSYLIKTDEDRMAYKKVYGDQWRQVIREKFHTQLLSKLENEQTLSHLHNPWIRRIIAAFSFKRTICPKSWEKKTPLSPGGSTICSEFTVKTILKAIHDINIVIKRDAENKGLTNLPQLNPEIDRHLRLEKLLPHEVCKLFLKSGLGVQIETPQVIQQYIEIPEVKIQYGGKV